MSRPQKAVATTTELLRREYSPQRPHLLGGVCTRAVSPNGPEEDCWQPSWAALLTHRRGTWPTWRSGPNAGGDPRRAPRRGVCHGHPSATGTAGPSPRVGSPEWRGLTSLVPLPSVLLSPRPAAASVQAPSASLPENYFRVLPTPP